MATTVRGLRFSYARQLYCDESHAVDARGDHYACTRALRTLLLLQAEPLKCALAQTRHRVPGPARPDALTKRHAHTMARRVIETICTPLRTKL